MRIRLPLRSLRSTEESEAIVARRVGDPTPAMQRDGFPRRPTRLQSARNQVIQPRPGTFRMSADTRRALPSPCALAESIADAAGSSPGAPHRAGGLPTSKPGLDAGAHDRGSNLTRTIIAENLCTPTWNAAYPVFRVVSSIEIRLIRRCAVLGSSWLRIWLDGSTSSTGTSSNWKRIMTRCNSIAAYSVHRLSRESI